MNVTVIGGGNIGTYFAVEFARKGHEVIVYSSKPENSLISVTLLSVRRTVISCFLKLESLPAINIFIALCPIFLKL